MLKSSLIEQPLYVVVITLPLVALFVKLTFYILFLRVFRPKKGLRWSIYIGIAVTVVFYTVTLIILLIWTTPKPGTSFVTTFVKFASEEKSPVLDTAFALGYFNIFSDTYILVLPISAVAGLNLPIRRKFGLSIVFMAGILYVWIFSRSNSEHLTFSGPFVVARSHSFIVIELMIPETRLGTWCLSDI